MRADDVGKAVTETAIEIGGVISVDPVSDGVDRKVVISVPYEKLEDWFETLSKRLG